MDEEARRSGDRVDRTVLLNRARAALETLAAPAAEEYAAYTRALDSAEAGRLTFGRRFAREKPAAPLAATAAAALAACVADLAAGTGTGTALGAGAAALVVGAAATVVKVTAAHLPESSKHAAARNQPGGVEQLRLQWLTALEVRGIRPFLDQQRMLSAASGTAGQPAPQRRRTDKSAAARRRTVLQQSFAQLPEAQGPFTGRRQEMTRIAQWVHAARAAPQTRPVVVLLHGEPGAGRTTLAVRAAAALKEQFRGACVVDLRGAGPDEPPLATRDALLHLLNRLGAPREQLLFRERASEEQRRQHVRRLAELYQKHLAGLPVVILLDDASDAEQVRTLVPERSESLVLVTSREPLALPEDLHAWVHRMPVTPLDAAGAEELLRAWAADEPGPYDADAAERVRELCGGLPLALRVVASSLGTRSARDLAVSLADYGPVGPVERALWLRYAEQPENARRLLRRLALAGRASLGAAAAAALLATDEAGAEKELTALAAAGLLDHVRGSRYRLHSTVRAFARARLADEEAPADRTAAQERLIVNYAELADSVIRLVEGKTSTRADAAFHAEAVGPHGFTSLEAALRWLDDETSFITAALRHAEGVNEAAVLHLLGALCDYCLLRGDLYRLGEISELTQSVDQGLLGRSVQWRTGIAARQVGELDTSRTTLSSVVDLYFEAHHEAGAARALGSLGITLHHQGNLAGAEEKLREALALQGSEALAGDRGWTLHALGAVLRDLARPREALELLDEALGLHRANESVQGEAWAHFQLGQTCLRLGEVPRAEAELRTALELYGRTHDPRGEAWALTQLARARLVDGDGQAAAEQLRGAASRHRDNEDARGAAWSAYYLGLALEDTGSLDQAVRELERARTVFSRMRDVYGLACARHHSARATRDQRAAQTGSLRNSGFARQLLVDARADFKRIGVAHGEAWTCLELAVVEAGNARAPQALALCDQATELFASYGDRRGGDWARFLRCTLLPYASPGGVEIGTAVAEEELAQLDRAGHAARDPQLEDCIPAYALFLERGVDLTAGWQAWRLRMVPGRSARDVMGVTGT
ncbi:hypothetical protein Sm713_09260 [Streptomyces sp. TS71-3]|nr:hypothetical protein Sm713_09260 [Streptomyces sp. TS71-3]